jgi:hypothetical protein
MFPVLDRVLLPNALAAQILNLLQLFLCVYGPGKLSVDCPPEQTAGGSDLTWRTSGQE